MSANPPHRQPVPYLEYGLLLLLAALWGASFSFLKLTVASIPPLTAIAWRTAIAGLLLWAIMHRQGIKLPIDGSNWRSFAIVSAVNTVFPFILIAWGLQWVPASLGVILNSTTPIFAFLITWALTRHEPITALKLFGVSAGLVGIVLIVGISALTGLGQQLTPQLAIVLASLSYATAAIYGRGFREMSPLVPACGSLLLGALILTPLALVVERPWNASPTAASVIALVILAVFCTALGNVLYFRLLGTLGSLGTTAQSYLRVPIGVLAGLLLLGEELTATAGIGLLCVVAGVMAMTWPSDKPAPVSWQTLGGVRSAISRRWLASPAALKDYALLLFVATLWAGSYIWVKIGLVTITPLTLMAGRIAIAAAFLHIVMLWSAKSLPAGREVWGNYAFQGALSTVLPFVLVAWGQQWVDAGPTAILNSVSPVFAFLITWGLTRHEPATPMKLFGVIAGLLGVVTVIGPATLFTLGRETLPQIAIVLSALCYALGAINSRHFKGADPLVTAAGALTAATAIILPVAIVVEQPWRLSPSWAGIASMLTLGVFSTGLGYMLYFRLVRSLGSIGVTAQSYLRAPVGVLLAAALLGEPVTAAMIAGMALVMIGVAAMTMPDRRSPDDGAAGR